MTSNIVLGVLILKIGTSAWRQREVLLSLTMFVCTYTDITETVIYVMLILTNGSMHTLDSMVKLKGI